MELNELIKMLESMISCKALYSEQIGSEFLYMRCRPDPKSCVIEQAAKELKRLAEIQEILGDTYDLDHLRELVEADRDGLISVITVPKGRICGTCKNFCRIKGKSYGVCSVRSFPKNRKGIEIQAKGKFTPYQSRPACKQYIFTDEGPEHYEMEGKNEK